MSRVAYVVLVAMLTVLFNCGWAEAKVVRLYVGKLNINSASSADLTRLPGIGEITAFRIVKERERRGKFAQTRELKEVKGVSVRLYSAIAPYITTTGENTLKVYLDVNTVTVPLLLGLPGMSEGEARSIIAYRKANGRLNTIQELLKVPGIDKKRFSELSEWLVVAN